jgi:peptidoglycan/LPS O-acetylase OafA/YrhL
MSSLPHRQDGQVPSHLRSPHGAASVHLDALRGIAAVGVCANHLRDLLLADYPQVSHHNPVMAAFYLVTGLGHQWVMIFFVLSGYLVGGSVLRAFSMNRWSWRSYLLSRLTRLYVVLIPALLLGGALDLAGIHLFGLSGIYGGHVGSHELSFDIPAHLRLSILLGNYVFLQGILVTTFGTNGPLWSLANEFWYYLAFPLLAIILVRGTSILLRIGALISLIFMLFFIGHAIALAGLIWLMGVLIHFLPPLRIEHALPRRLLILAAAGACVATLAWCKVHSNPASDYLLGAVVTALIYVILCCSRTPAPRAYRWTAQTLSHSSYTLYLVHLPFVVFVIAWVGHIRLQPTASQLLLMLAIFAAALIYAQIVWFLFEKRTDTLREWIKPFVLGAQQKSVSNEKVSLTS